MIEHIRKWKLGTYIDELDSNNADFSYIHLYSNHVYIWLLKYSKHRDTVYILINPPSCGSLKTSDKIWFTLDENTPTVRGDNMFIEPNHFCIKKDQISKPRCCRWKDGRLTLI